MKGDRNRPFHILQVVHGLVIGGAERVVCDLTKHFNNGMFRTSVCCLDELGEFGKDLIEEGISVQIYKRKPGIDYRLLRELRSLYREWKIDLVHAHQYTPYFYAATACLGASFPKAIFTEHGRHQPDRMRPKRVIFNQFLRTVTVGYTAVSKFTRQNLIEFEKMPCTRIRVIYNGVPFQKKGAGHEKKVSRMKLGIELDKKVVLSVGRMDPIKDFLTLIRAFKDVVHEVSDASLLIAGDGDVHYLEKLQRSAEQLGIRDHVNFLGSRRDIQDLLDACDVFTLTSICEGASMTILEAMASARPVVATLTGGNPELVKDGDTGYLVPVGDYRSVSEAIIKVLTCPDRAKRMENAGRMRIESFFSRDSTLDAYRKLYEEILCR
jgi:glycosyltransferase involved in cell wall biosynthesis